MGLQKAGYNIVTERQHKSKKDSNTVLHGLFRLEMFIFKCSFFPLEHLSSSYTWKVLPIFQDPFKSHLHCGILQTVWVLWGLILLISCAIGSAPLGLVFCVKTHLCTHLWSRLQWWWSWSLPSSLLSSRNGKKNEKLIIALYNFFFNLLFILYWSIVDLQCQC